MYGNKNDENQNNGYASDDIINASNSLKGLNEKRNEFNESKGNKSNSFNNGGNSLSKLNNANLGNNAKDIAKNTASDTAKDTAKDTLKEAANEELKKGAAAVAEGAAASTGVGTAVVAAQKGIKLIDKGLSIITQQEHDKHWYIYLLIGIAIMISYGTITMTAWHGNIGASSEIYHEDQYGKSGNTESSRSYLSIFKGWFTKFFDSDEEVGEYDPYHPLNEALTKNLDIINKAFGKAYEMAKIETQEAIVEFDYDYDLTIESFESNPYPYENINYAELLSVISEKDIYNAENIKISDFKKLFMNSLDNDKLRYLYCMNIEEAYKTVRFYYNSSGNEVRISENEDAPDGIEVSEKEVKYGKVILVKYDLKSLYEMIKLDPNERNTHYRTVNNIDMIDCQEETMRFGAVDFDLGPKIRTVWDYGISRKGITKSYEDYIEFMEYLQLYDGDITEAQKQLLDAAISKLGTTYSQNMRNKEGYFDCSSFCAWAYRDTLGIQFGDYSPVAANMCKYLETTSHQVSSGYSNNLQVGDLLFYSGNINNRYKNVTHVAMYAGNGKIIDASSSKGKVVYRDVWGKDEIVSVCRPLD